MPDKKKEVFIPDKDNKYNQIFDKGDVKYKKCPVCKDNRESPDSFAPEGLCIFCVEDVFTEHEFFEIYLKAIKKGYIKPVMSMHNLFFPRTSLSF